MIDNIITVSTVKGWRSLHNKVERIYCRAESLGPITLKHEFSGRVEPQVLHCTSKVHTAEEEHHDGNCCWKPHDFPWNMATEPENRDESYCGTCNAEWPCAAVQAFDALESLLTMETVREAVR